MYVCHVYIHLIFSIHCTHTETLNPKLNLHVFALQEGKAWWHETINKTLTLNPKH